MSKGLEALRTLQQNLKVYPVGSTKLIGIIEKELKALEIIKEKPQATLWLIQVCDKKTEYEDMICIFKEDITKEQFDLLKEVLVCH